MKRHAENNDATTADKLAFQIRKSIWEYKYQTEVREFKQEYYLKFGDQMEYIRTFPPTNDTGHYFSVYSGNVSLRLAKQTLIDDLDLYHVNPLTGVVVRLVTWIDWPTHGWAVYGYVRYARRLQIEQLTQPEERIHADLCIVESL